MRPWSAIINPEPIMAKVENNRAMSAILNDNQLILVVVVNSLFCIMISANDDVA